MTLGSSPDEIGHYNCHPLSKKKNKQITFRLRHVIFHLSNDQLRRTVGNDEQIVIKKDICTKSCVYKRKRCHVRDIHSNVVLHPDVWMIGRRYSIFSFPHILFAIVSRCRQTCIELGRVWGLSLSIPFSYRYQLSIVTDRMMASYFRLACFTAELI